MPRTKKTVASEVEKKPTRRGRPSKKSLEKTSSSSYLQAFGDRFQANRKKYIRYLIVLAVIIVIGVLAFINKQWFVVAVVNREPITTVEFYQNLKAKYGDEVLSQLMQNKLIAQEAQRRNVKVTTAEVDKKLKEVEAQLGGAQQFKQALQQSSLTEGDYRKILQTRLLVEKMLVDKIKITDADIDDYIKKNPEDAAVTGSDNKGPDREAIRTKLRNNKVNDLFPKWYQDLEKRSSLIKFI